MTIAETTQQIVFFLGGPAVIITASTIVSAWNHYVARKHLENINAQLREVLRTPVPSAVAVPSSELSVTSDGAGMVRSSRHG